MGIKVKSIRSEMGTLDAFKYGDEELHVGYFKHAYTPRLELEASATDVTGAGEALIKMTLPIIASWDLENEYPVYQYVKGEKVEPNHTPTATRIFAINGEAGTIGEWDAELVKPEPDGNSGDLAYYIHKFTQVYTDGQPRYEARTVPISEQGLLDVPLNVLTDIIKAVGEALSPGEVKNSSSGGSLS